MFIKTILPSNLQELLAIKAYASNRHIIVHKEEKNYL